MKQHGNSPASNSLKEVDFKAEFCSLFVYLENNPLSGKFSPLCLLSLYWHYSDSMMDLPQSAITELQEIYKEDFQVDLTLDEAKAEARRILLFFHKMLLFVQEHGDAVLADQIKQSQ
ncbi:MAG: hypothetical protein ACRBF0_14990 [Calditrichia bacterium]